MLSQKINAANVYLFESIQHRLSCARAANMDKSWTDLVQEMRDNQREKDIFWANVHEHFPQLVDYVVLLASLYCRTMRCVPPSCSDLAVQDLIFNFLLTTSACHGLMPDQPDWELADALVLIESGWERDVIVSMVDVLKQTEEGPSPCNQTQQQIRIKLPN